MPFMYETVPGCVMVARQTLDLLVGVQILPGEQEMRPTGVDEYSNAFRRKKNPLFKSNIGGL